MPEPSPAFTPDPNELHERWKHADEFVSKMNQRAIEAALDVAKEKTQYLEKIALAAGGTIALVVSFVGAHAGRLQPPWLLRSALVTLVLTMIAAGYRNWRYPFYVIHTHARQELAARLNREQAKCALMRVAVDVYSVERGPKDVPQYLAESAAAQEKNRKQIALLQHKANCALWQVEVVERIALLLMVASMGMLIALAWRNF